MNDPRPDPDPGTSDQDALEQRQAESLARIEQGGIPLDAERRLSQLAGALRQDGVAGASFTSDLSVADFALCHQLKLRPLSQVMGSSIYQVGYQSTPWPSMLGGGFMFELDTLSDAWNDVRTRTLGRLRQEAGHVGADAVIGVELRTGQHDWAENAIEYVVIGTAVRDQNARSSRRHGPILTELSVADYAKLARANIEPLGIVAWSSVFFVAAYYTTQMLGGSGFMENQELGEFTQGVYSAREIVMGRLSAQAAELGASGVIGTRIDHHIGPVSLGGGRYQRGGLMVTFHAIGTAIVEDRHITPYAPKPIVDLTT